MKAAISGSNGFIARHLKAQLLLMDYQIHPIERALLQSPMILSQFFADIQPDYIFHLAAYGNMSNQKIDDEIIYANIIGTWNMLQASRDIDYKAFINVSSSSVTLPHETIYSASKTSGEALCKAYVDEYKKPIISLRPYSVYGEYEADFRFIPTVFRSCLKGEPMVLAPEATHDWVYVSDVIDKMIGLLPTDNTDMYITEAGTGIATFNRDVVDMIEEITGKKANISEEKELRSFDTISWCSEAALPTTLKEGLQKCYEYYKERYKE